MVESATPDPFEADADLLEVEAVAIDPEGYLPEQRALETAGSLYSFEAAFPGVTVDAFLRRVDDPSHHGTEPEIRDRAVWIVRYLGIDQVTSGPPRADGSPGIVRHLRRAYVFVDAESGEFLFTRYVEEAQRV